ncbi:hypothetical protein EYZ11_012739 [Aspergillus tanneri]|uniref:Uncharacterized protein n=1 Tax=Aspergillus tanneri TaxID=1220188 RepID=A0A4S3IZG7_9EURO|nr:hypothetical protein EYZ11_012739 [Aspergillus tanneri]
MPLNETSWALIGVLTCALIIIPFSLRYGRNYWIPDELYSPARDVIRYKTTVFDSGFERKTKYMGPPTEENEQAWEDLYQDATAGISIIPIDQAAKLPNKTVPIQEAPGYYVVQLDVFHQLHCLNQLRLKIWGSNPVHSGVAVKSSTDNSTDSDPLGLQEMDHLDHCVDSIRQSLMCSSDISAIIWIWHEESQATRPLANSTHTCRDFEAVRQWALDRQAPEWDESIHVADPLKGEN